MLPLSDGVPARRFPVVTVLLIVANFAVWLLYELPNLNGAIFHASFYPCTINDACHGPEPWGLSWITAMFLHGGWDHILGNMLFLAIFGKNVEDAFGPVRYLIFYFAGGFVAMLTQSGITLLFGTAADARVPTLGASGAIAAVLGAYFVLYPGSRVRTWIFPVFLVRIPAWIFLGCGSSTSSSRRTSDCSARRRTAAASPSSRTSAGSCSACGHPGPQRSGTHRRPAGSLGLPCGASGVGTAVTPP
jgi:membrane associated rhomboid family serine protease